MPPTRIGAYEVDSAVIGRGSYSSVKTATHVEDGTRWALKVVSKSSFDQHPHLREQLTYEVRIQKLLMHPHIVQLREVLSTKNYFCLVLELAERGDVFEHILRLGRLSEAAAQRYFQQLLEGVQYLHAHHVVHRDLKPENLLLTRDDCLKISDFGLAVVQRVLDKETGEVQLCEDFWGTPHYVAPELLTRTKYDGRPADMWSCGVILYVMLTGAFPFDGESPEELMAAINVGTYRAPLVLLSAAATDLLKKLLCRNPLMRLSASAALQHPWLKPQIAVPRFIPTRSTRQLTLVATSGSLPLPTVVPKTTPMSATGSESAPGTTLRKAEDALLEKVEAIDDTVPTSSSLKLGAVELPVSHCKIVIDERYFASEADGTDKEEVGVEALLVRLTHELQQQDKAVLDLGA